MIKAITTSPAERNNWWSFTFRYFYYSRRKFLIIIFYDLYEKKKGNLNFDPPGRHVYCFKLTSSISNNTTNCLACGPCFLLCSNAIFIYFSKIWMVDRINSAFDIVWSIPHISMPANGITITIRTIIHSLFCH